MSLVFVIDGYNIIKSPQLTRITRKNAAISHSSFLSYIRNRRLTGSQRNRVIVVFDGFPPVSSAPHAREEGMETVFSGSYSADERINQLVEHSRNPRNVVVVTDDRQLRFSVSAAGARVMSAGEFLKIDTLTAKDKRGAGQKPESAVREEKKLSYSQQESINRELRKLWLT